MLWWLEQVFTIHLGARGSQIRTCLSLQEVPSSEPSDFQLRDCITSVCSLLAEESIQVSRYSLFTHRSVKAIVALILQKSSCCETTSHSDKFVYETVVSKCSAVGCQWTTSTRLCLWEKVHSGLQRDSSKPDSGMCQSFTWKTGRNWSSKCQRLRNFKASKIISRSLNFTTYHFNNGAYRRWRKTWNNDSYEKK